MKMDPADVLVFEQVVESGSFTAAGKKLGLPTSSVSRRVSRLEDTLGTRLLQRTTRQLHLTDAGRLFHSYTHRIAEDLDNAERAITEMSEQPRGTIRVTAPDDAGMWGMIERFMEAYPDVTVEIEISRRKVDIVAEGFDVALRGGAEPGTPGSLIARRVGYSTRMLVASPEYLQQHGTPSHPSELADHPAVVFVPWTGNDQWTMQWEGEAITIPVHGRFRSNHLRMVAEATRAGFGIAQCIGEFISNDLESGRLVQILGGAVFDTSALWIIYPSKRHLSPAVRAFIDHAAKELETSLMRPPLPDC